MVAISVEQGVAIVVIISDFDAHWTGCGNDCGALSQRGKSGEDSRPEAGAAASAGGRERALPLRIPRRPAKSSLLAGRPDVQPLRMVHAP